MEMVEGRATEKMTGNPSLSHQSAGVRCHSQGFTLIELLIVVIIIGIVASLAIPSLLQSKMAANEANAISYMRQWTSAQELYLLRFDSYADADGQLFDAGLIGKGAADSHGYTFSLDNPSGSQTTWWGTATPDTPGSTGSRWFFLDDTGVIRFSTSGSAGRSDPPIYPVHAWVLVTKLASDLGQEEAGKVADLAFVRWTELIREEVPNRNAQIKDYLGDKRLLELLRRAVDEIWEKFIEERKEDS